MGMEIQNADCADPGHHRNRDRRTQRDTHLVTLSRSIKELRHLRDLKPDRDIKRDKRDRRDIGSRDEKSIICRSNLTPHRDTA